MDWNGAAGSEMFWKLHLLWFVYWNRYVYAVMDLTTIVWMSWVLVDLFRIRHLSTSITPSPLLSFMVEKK